MAFNLMAAIGLNTRSFVTGLTTVQSQVRTFSRNVSNALTGFAARTLGAAALGAAAKSTSDFAERMVDLRGRTGLAVEELQRLEYAATRGGSSLEKIIQIQERVGAAMFEAAQGSEEMINRLTRLGVSFENIRTGNVHAAFMQISDTIKNAGNNAALFGDASKVMGRGFGELLPAMRDGLKEVGDQLEAIGGVMGTEQIDRLNISAKEFQNIWFRARPYVGAVVNLLTKALSDMGDLLALGAEVSPAKLWSEFASAEGNPVARAKAVLDSITKGTDEVMRKRKARQDALAEAGKVKATSVYESELEEAEKTFGKIQSLKESIARKEFDLQLEGLGVAEKILKLEQERAKLRGDKMGPLNEADSLSLRDKELDFDKKLADLRNGKTSSTALEINQLQRIGAFSAGAAGNPLLTVAQKQEQHLSKSVQALTKIVEQTRPRTTSNSGVQF